MFAITGIKMLIPVINSEPVPHNAQSPLKAVVSGVHTPAGNASIAKPLQRALQGAFNPSSPVPLYSQIRELLRARITDGTFAADGKMPSENEMVKAFGVSRITVRQALNDLQKEGLIFKIHGKGTFVAKPKAVQSLMRLEGFGEAMSASGHETHSRVLGHRVLRPGRAVAARLGVNDKTEVMEIQRIRYLDRNPISLDVTYVPLDIGRRLIKEDLQRRDIFLILENDYGFSLDRAELRVDAMLADAKLAETLAMPEASPVLRIERLTFATGERPLDFEYLYYRGDAFQYFMMVGRRNGAHRPAQNPLPRGVKK
jgi:GntR family transcriptional regulator